MHSLYNSDFQFEHPTILREEFRMRPKAVRPLIVFVLTGFPILVGLGVGIGGQGNPHHRGNLEPL